MRGSGEETSCNLTVRVISFGLGTRPGFLLSQPHFYSVELLSLPLAMYKTIDGFIPRPKHLGRLASFSTMAASSVYQCSDSGGSQGMGMRLG